MTEPTGLRALLTRRPRFVPRAPGRSPASYEDPVIVLSPSVLARYNARVLDPATSIRVVGQENLRSTVYIADQLLITGGVRDDDARKSLNTLVDERGLQFRPPLEPDRRVQLRAVLAAVGRDDLSSELPAVHALVPKPGSTAVADAWEILQSFRAVVEAA